MGLWIAALEAEDGSWSDEPFPTDGTKETAISNAQAWWPTVPSGHRIALYKAEFVQEVEAPGPAIKAALAALE